VRRLVIVESPFSADTPELFARNLQYLKACVLDCLQRGESPYASHGFFPNFLHDANAEERELGMDCGFDVGHAFAAAARARLEDKWLADDEAYAEQNLSTRAAQVVYTDLGISSGMQRGVEALDGILPREDRQLGEDWARLIEGRETIQHIKLEEPQVDGELLEELRRTERHVGNDAALGAAVRKLLNT
jgi:hypothetical protein